MAINNPRPRASPSGSGGLWTINPWLPRFIYYVFKGSSTTLISRGSLKFVKFFFVWRYSEILREIHTKFVLLHYYGYIQVQYASRGYTGTWGWVGRDWYCFRDQANWGNGSYAGTNDAGGVAKEWLVFRTLTSFLCQ